MRRETVYPGQVLPETVLLNMGRDVMTGMGKLMQDILGSGPSVSGFACTPTAPASLQVNIAPGNIYAMQSVEASPWSTLPGDTAHTILKQGILPDPVSLTLTPPTATGLAINYLVQVAYQDQDINPAVLPYYNSANPSQPFTGQGNNGQSQATARDGVAVVSLKAGIAAPSGNQQTPAPDTGYVGLWVITVLNGQTTVTAQNITAMPGAPYINPSMLGMSPSLIQSPAQFDKSTKLATTEFVQRARGGFAGTRVVTLPYTITAADLGCLILPSNSGTLTFPATAFPAGESVFVSPSVSGLTVTLATDGAGLGLNGVAFPTLQIFSGDQIQLVSQKSSFVSAINYSAWNSGVSLAASGWQKLPSGLIIQWGGGSVLGTQTITLPTAFPTAGLAVLATGQTAADAAVGGSCWVEGGFVSPSQIFLKTVTSSPSGNANGARGVSWLAIGR